MKKRFNLQLFDDGGQSGAGGSQGGFQFSFDFFAGFALLCEIKCVEHRLFQTGGNSAVIHDVDSSSVFRRETFRRRAGGG